MTNAGLTQTLVQDYHWLLHVHGDPDELQDFVRQHAANPDFIRCAEIINEMWRKGETEFTRFVENVKRAWRLTPSSELAAVLQQVYAAI